MASADLKMNGGDMPVGGPDIEVSVRQTFGLDSDLQVPAFSQSSDYVPEVDETYRFDRDTTLAILAGFAHNRRVMIQGYHGTGKSTHIEQVSARLNWPCIRVNLDSHISRSEEHTSELQSLMRISYAVFCLKKKKKTTTYNK